jgi:hypothetical protein
MMRKGHVQQPSKRAWTRLSRAPAYATRKRAPGDTMADRSQRRTEILGYNNVELKILRAHYPSLTHQVIADCCQATKAVARDWVGRKGRHTLPMPVAMLEKLKRYVESLVQEGQLRDRWLDPLMSTEEIVELTKS